MGFIRGTSRGNSRNLDYSSDDNCELAGESSTEEQV